MKARRPLIEISAVPIPLPAFTPGPWLAPNLWDATGLTENHVAHAPDGGGLWKSDTPTICVFPADRLNWANAKLIAAAPDLFAACMALIGTFDPEDRALVRASSLAVAALKKASGK